MKTSRVTVLVLFCACFLPFSTVAGKAAIGDNFATTVDGHEIIKLQGELDKGKFTYKEGGLHRMLFLHLYRPINWWPESKKNAARKYPLHSVAHAYDMQVLFNGDAAYKKLDSLVGTGCIVVTGGISSLELHEAQGLGPLALGIYVKSVERCGSTDDSEKGTRKEDGAN